MGNLVTLQMPAGGRGGVGRKVGGGGDVEIKPPPPALLRTRLQMLEDPISSGATRKSSTGQQIHWSRFCLRLFSKQTFNVKQIAQVTNFDSLILTLIISSMSHNTLTFFIHPLTF